MRKILAISLFVLSVFGIGAALYFAFFRSSPTQSLPPAGETIVPIQGGTFPVGGSAGERPVTNEGEGALPPASTVAQGGITQTTELTTSAVSNIALANNGSSMNYYDPTDGHFYTIDASGAVHKLSDRTFPDVKTAKWNHAGEKAVLEFPDGSNIVYDFQNQTQVTLPAHWEDFAFSPVKDELIAKSMALDPNNRWLVTSNADGSNVRAFQALGENANKVQIAWSPNDQVIAFADTVPSQGSLDRKLIIPIGKNQENFKGLTVEGLGFLPHWSPDGSTLLYSAFGDFSDAKPLLWLVNATPGTMGQNRRSIGLNTWADKCAFADAASLYCAVPTSLPSNAGLQRTLFRHTPDNLYKIDLATGRSSLVAIPTNNAAMEHLTVSKDGANLFFINEGTGKLERLRLK